MSEENDVVEDESVKAEESTNEKDMSTEEKKSPLALEPHEKEAFWYILGVPVLIFLIVGLAMLTHVVLSP
ncbi:MAG: hypothetical protein AAF462_04195 [Thermodesulfobacteriota bacterium]